ncbi:phage terminase large subunit [Burkholderia multivorans]|uniref:phage terminase large subunit n=1 Tax=Burkholderia multivorans TaxID=87883 RepID=UPI001C2123EF|nr:phage terminase large subunit [Burkholderia multivorans]MBU9668867.1 phage terminase large subunit [Burkholderia multivorans]HEF4757113.1 phage terminase large subunit [Burkholderia multivorans]
MLAGVATHLMLFGGSRSGKTFLHVRNIVMRAIKAPGSRHGIFRFRALHVHESIVLDTFPKVMRIAFPNVRYTMHKGDGYAVIHTGVMDEADNPIDSEIWFSGLDDKERVEKVLGKEFATLYFNECSQIPMGSVDIAITRLAQLVYTRIEGREPKPLKMRAYYDCNPPSKAHWTYKRFIQKVDPETGEPLSNPADYDSFQINPHDNAQNLSDNYLKTLEGMSARLQKRFLKGEFSDATPNQLFAEETIDRWRHRDDEPLPDMVRVVVAVDPSGSGDVDNADNDEIGIAVVGLGTNGVAYLLEDCTVKAGPATWGSVAASAYDRHAADLVVGEGNFGGAMVQHVILTARPRTPFKMVTASRGKAVRAEPFSSLYEQGKVRHVGQYRELEDELTSFSTVGYLGEGSPNRADALIWALTEIFPGIVRDRAKKKEYQTMPRKQTSIGGYTPGSWMGS